MPGIYPMAVLTILGSALLWGGLLYALSGRQRRYLWLLLPGLPLSALVNLLVKAPLAVGVGRLAGIPPHVGLATPMWFIAFAFMLAPVFEEAIKIAPLLLPWVWAFLGNPVDALWGGTALGIGFGLGEAAYLAWGVAQSPQYAGIPWYAFTGYAGERTAVCFVHGAITAVVVSGVQQGGWHALLGYLGGVALHALLNVGALLFQLGQISAEVTQLTLLAAIVLSAALWEWRRRQALRGPGAPDRSEEVVYFRRG